MAYSIFNQEINDTLKEPMFFGDSVNVARGDQQTFEIFEKLTEKQRHFLRSVIEENAISYAVAFVYQE